MAKKVTAQVVGGDPLTFDDLETIGDLRKEMDLGPEFTATMNDEPAKDDTKLTSFAYVSFAESVKGA